MNLPLAIALSTMFISLSIVICKLIEESFKWKRSWSEEKVRELKKELDLCKQSTKKTTYV